MNKISDLGENTQSGEKKGISNIHNLGFENKIKQVFELNSYGRLSLKQEEKLEKHQIIIDEFIDYFVGNGYKKEESVGINSGIDESVYFIGAPISVLKPYIVSENIPNEGICIEQASLRTHNTKALLNDSNMIRWGSTFTGLACLVKYENIEILLQKTIDFLLKTLNIPLSNIAININSIDYDLQELLTRINNPISCVYDTKPEVYYTHKYGMGDIVGRNFNFVLRNENNGGFNDIGNFIIIENGDKKYGVELALGTSVIMKELYGLEHLLDTSIISDLIPGIGVNARKLQDCIITSVLLFRLGIIPNSSNTKGRIFKKYLAGVLYNSSKLGISLEEIKKVSDFYELHTYGENTGSGDFIVSSIV